MKKKKQQTLTNKHIFRTFSSLTLNLTLAKLCSARAHAFEPLSIGCFYSCAFFSSSLLLSTSILVIGVAVAIAVVLNYHLTKKYLWWIKAMCITTFQCYDAPSNGSLSLIRERAWYSHCGLWVNEWEFSYISIYPLCCSTLFLNANREAIFRSSSAIFPIVFGRVLFAELLLNIVCSLVCASSFSGCYYLRNIVFGSFFSWRKSCRFVVYSVLLLLLLLFDIVSYTLSLWSIKFSLYLPVNVYCYCYCWLSVPW